jgi:photosystem II stability/assembly factor-like uncharacterized protein
MSSFYSTPPEARREPGEKITGMATRRVAARRRRLRGVLLSFGAASLLLAAALGKAAPTPTRVEETPSPYRWAKLKTEPFRGKQDDIFFINTEVGWYVNGSGKIFKTTDGGVTWVKKLDKPGTFFRCIGFVDERRGFAGNVGPDYYPNVSDAVPLYETKDGGETWEPVTRIKGPAVKGLCAIEILHAPPGDAGKRGGGGKPHIYAGGRVGGPAFLIKSLDGGDTWEAVDMSRHCAMILDIKFIDRKRGVISAATASSPEKSNALILMTEDGGKSWTKRYQSDRLYELTWKSSFPSRDVGYVTVQNYNPDKSVTRRVVAKTVDGGKTWTEMTLADDFNLREFGVGFIDKNTGWVGGTTGGYETTDGGKTWRPVEMGKAVNKIRLLKTEGGFVGYAIGVDVYKLDRRKN